MDSVRPTSPEPATQSPVLVIDACCDRFELAWRAGQGPRIEQYLNGVSESDRGPLLTELVLLELELRRRRGDEPSLEEYQGRFPGETELVAGLFAAGSSSGDRTELDRRGTKASREPLPMTLFPVAETNLGPGEARAPAAGPEQDRSFDYQLLEELGRGAMGVVFKARQRHLNRLVAFKMIRDGGLAGSTQTARFRTEAKAVAQLRHPNIVQIHDVGIFNGLPFLALELLEGGTLAARLGGTPQRGRAAAELVAVLARAIDAAHRAGIIHRDLKPANVLFDHEGTPKIVDFGLAKRVEVEHGETQSEQVMGTPSYMAPEQARGGARTVGPAADVYALGAILYEMLTGRPPFKGPTPMETVYQVIHEEPVAPSRLQPKVPRDLETICLKCLMKEPHRRYASAVELDEDLARYLKGEPIRARPTPVWERAAKWARRNPGKTALAATALVAAGGLALAAELRRDALRRTTLERVQRVSRLRSEALDDLDRGRRQRTDGELDESRNTLSALLAKLKVQAEPQLADIEARARDEASLVMSQRGAAAARAAEAERLARFGQLRDQALLLDGYLSLFPETLATATTDKEQRVLPRKEQPAAQIRVAAANALEVFRPAGGGRAVGLDLPDWLPPAERAAIEADQDLMLMVLSEAMARPLTGEDAAAQASAALSLLDRLSASRGDTPAFHLRRAACLERRGERAAAEGERARASAARPRDAYDFLLLGREESHHGDWDAARPHLEEALRLRPDSFWAHCLLAVAELNSTPSRAAEA
jgi:tRNA A-37 threonylcarbamoyl transferase component Bud32